MQKLLNKFFSLVIICFIVFGSVSVQQVSAKVDKGIPVVNEEMAQDLTFDGSTSKIKDLDIEPINTDKVKNNVIPDTKQEGKKLLGLFIKTMLLVVFCSIILYVILLMIKKFNKSNFVFSDEEYDSAEMLQLYTPETKNEALKSFLDRTK